MEVDKLYCSNCSYIKDLMKYMAARDKWVIIRMTVQCKGGCNNIFNIEEFYSIESKESPEENPSSPTLGPEIKGPESC